VAQDSDKRRAVFSPAVIIMRVTQKRGEFLDCQRKHEVLEISAPCRKK